MNQGFRMLIGGELVGSDESFSVINPETEEVLADVPSLSPDQVQAALSSAKKAFSTWGATPLGPRREAILRYADTLEAHQDEIIDLLIAETGKPFDNAEYDFDMLPTCLRFFVEEAARIDQAVIPDPDGRFLNYTLRQPLGVAVGYLAWNFPLLNFGYKLGPVLASGCTAIIKPSQRTPLATLRCAELLVESGIPPGVINVVTSNDYATTEPFLTSPVPSLFTMIGSTSAGVAAMKTACTNVKHFSVELGGNAPVVVYDDADVRRAAENVVDLKFANTGQVCVSPNRCFVHADVYESFLEVASEHAAGIEFGAGRGGGRRMGPMTSGRDRDRVLSLIQTAEADGASVVCGGRVPEHKPRGYFMEPTILRDVRPEMSLSCEEVFGPVLPVIRFTNEDDIIAMANATDYGLAAYVYTRNLARGLQAAAGIDSGSVCVNEFHYAVHLPHGGVKQSGVGRDCSRYSLEEYLTLKRVSICIDA